MRKKQRKINQHTKEPEDRYCPICGEDVKQGELFHRCNSIKINKIKKECSKTEKKEISLKALAPKYEMSFGYPTGTFQFYHLTYTFEKENVLPFILNKVSVNGQEIRDFTISGIDDKTIAIRGYQRRYPQYNKKVTGNTDVSR